MRYTCNPPDNNESSLHVYAISFGSDTRGSDLQLCLSVSCRSKNGKGTQFGSSETAIPAQPGRAAGRHALSGQLAVARYNRS